MPGIVNAYETAGKRFYSKESFHKKRAANPIAFQFTIWFELASSLPEVLLQATKANSLSQRLLSFEVITPFLTKRKVLSFVRLSFEPVRWFQKVP